MGTPLAVSVVIALAAANAPAVAPETIAAFAEAESGRDAWAIGDNTTGLAHHPATKEDAIALARRLTAAGHRLDLGLMQISDRNFGATRLTIETALDPDISIRAAEQIIVAAYRQCAPGRNQEEALLCMASRYNTGNANSGLTNGYNARVWRIAERLVPAIRSAGVATEATPPPSSRPLPPPGVSSRRGAGRELVFPPATGARP